MNRAIITLTNGSTVERTVSIREDADIVYASLSREDIPAGAKTVDFLPDYGAAAAGEEGYMIVPAWKSDSSGHYMLVEFRNREDCELVRSGMLMPIWGMKNPRGCFVAIVTGMKYDFRLAYGVKGGKYYAYPCFTLDGDAPYEDLAVEFHLLTGKDASYSGMARCYRRFQLERGACVPLTERRNPELEYMVNSVYIRLRNAWKPCPSEIHTQTLENEPEMVTALTFDDVSRIVDSLKEAGVGEAELCLVGWNLKGHEGRVPTHFPVEPALGGEEKLRELIKHTKDAGYAIVCHSVSMMSVEISEDWTPDDIIKLKDGKLRRYSTVGSGDAYHVCPKVAMDKYGVRDLPRIADLGFRGTHFIDQISIYPPRKCYDPIHPQTTADYVNNYRRLSEYSRKLFGSFSSEGVYDFLAGELDYALYVAINENMYELGERLVPMWQLVYHGIIVSTDSSRSVNYTLKDWRDRLHWMEFGGRPVMYYYSKHVHGSWKTWMGEEDLTGTDDESMRRNAAEVRKAYDDYLPLRSLQWEFMDDHEMIDADVFMTTYSSGRRFVFNYRDEEYETGGVTVPAHDWKEISSTFQPAP